MIVPESDLVYRNAFSLLMQDVTFARWSVKYRRRGQCDHLLFSRPGVDSGSRCAETGKPLPLKYMVTDTGVPELLATITLMSNWNLAPKTTDALFTFTPPSGAKKTEFMPPTTGLSFTC